MGESETAHSLSKLRIERKRRTRPRRRRWIVAAAVLVAAAVVVAVLLVRRPPVVEVAQVREARIGEQLTELTAAGYVASRRRSIVAPKVPGRLDELLVEEGERVEEGEVIARLDPVDAEVALQQARAEQRAARAALTAAEATRRRALRELDRARELAEAGAEAQQTYDEAQSVFDAADAERSASRARLEAARQAVAAAELGVDNTIVRAPFTGTVVRKLADEGAVLAPATIAAADVGGIVEMVDLSDLEVETEVSEDDLSRVRIGQPALIFLDAWPNRVWRGVAESVRPSIDRSKATAVVKVRFEDAPQGVLPDMAARVSFLERPMQDGALAERARLRVPDTALVERDGRPVLLAVGDDGRVEEVPVQPAKRVGDEWALRQGPPAGTQIVEAPRDRLDEGDRVRVEVEGS